MGPDARLQDLTPAEVLHERLMWEIVRRVRDTDHVLKGGCALAFAYRAPRHPADIDFDAKKPTDMMRRIRNGFRAVGAVMTFDERIQSRDAPASGPSIASATGTSQSSSWLTCDSDQDQSLPMSRSWMASEPTNQRPSSSRSWTRSMTGTSREICRTWLFSARNTAMR